MHNVLRILLLTVCLATGIAVAVAVALKKPRVQAEAAPVAVAALPEQTVAAEPMLERPPTSTMPDAQTTSADDPAAFALTGTPIFEPILVPYRDLIAQQSAPPALPGFGDTPPAGAESNTKPVAQSSAAQSSAAQPLAVEPAPADPLPPAEPEGAQSSAPAPPATQPVASAQAQPVPEPPPVPEPLPSASPREAIRDEGDGRLDITLQETDIRDVLEQLARSHGINIMASKSVTGAVTANLTQVDLDSALSAILKSAGFVARRDGNILYVGTPADFAAMDQTQDRILTRVYRPNYIKAADFQTLITPLLSPDVGKSTVSSPAEVDIPSDQTKTGGDSFASGDVVVVHDYETVLQQLDEIFNEVDVKPKQVAIEAMILSVKLSDSFKLGVDFEALRNKDNARLISGSPLSTLAAIDVKAGGLKFGFMDESLSLFIDALETVGDTNVIAAPRLTCLNKQRAEIQIGEELGYISTTVTETSATQTVNFLDVGTLLRIRPFISSDGLVRLEVHPELSSGFIESVEGQSLPNKVVTQVTTNVMCPDGCTVIIGGLIREDLKTNTRQIPLLGNLPWVGPAFRQKTEETERSEIIVVITPRIVSEPEMAEEGMKYGNEFTQRQSVYFDKMSPIAKRNYGLHHLRMARAAYAAEDYNTAMKQVNLAIHYDPVNRDAIVLRNEVVAAGGFEDESIHEYLHRGLAPLTGRHRDYSKRGYPWKEFEGFGEPEMGHHDDPGQPGHSITVERPPPLTPVVAPEGPSAGPAARQHLGDEEDSASAPPLFDEPPRVDLPRAE